MYFCLQKTQVLKHNDGKVSSIASMFINGIHCTLYSTYTLGGHSGITQVRLSLQGTGMEVRNHIRSADWLCNPTPRAAESIHFPLHCRSFGWDHKYACFPLTVSGPYHVYRNGEVIIFLLGKKNVITFFPFQTDYIYAFPLIFLLYIILYLFT